MKPHFGQSDAVMNKLAGYTKAEHEEAAGMSLDDMFMAQHDQPCDCAVCDDIAFRRSLSETLANDKNTALRKAEFWREAHNAACVDAIRYREALEVIATYHAEKDRVWSNDMKQIAREALEGKQPANGNDASYREGYNAAVYFAGGLISEQEPKELTSALAELVWRLKL